MEYTWIISYRIVGNNKILTMERDLHLKTAHRVGNWFNMCHNGVDGRRKLEFVNAKLKEDDKNMPD